MAAFLRLVAEKKVNLTPLITHRFKLAKANDAYALVQGKTSEPYLGVLFEYNQQPMDVSRTRVDLLHPVQTLTGKLGVGVIGAGNFAQSMLLPHFKRNKNVTLLGVVTLDPLQARDVADRFNVS